MIITRDDGTSIAYHYFNGKSPQIVFLSGFHSNMMGAKAQAIEAFCLKHGRGFLRFDYFGHGESSGDINEGTIGRWANDVISMIDQITKEPILLVGSSILIINLCC